MPTPLPPQDGRALAADSPWLVRACYALALCLAGLALAVAWATVTGRSDPFVGVVGAVTAGASALGFARLARR